MRSRPLRRRGDTGHAPPGAPGTAAGWTARHRDADEPAPVDDDSPRRRPPRPARRSRSRTPDYDADDGIGFRCPFCGTGEWPRTNSRVSAGGWVLFVVLLLFCLPLFWLGFFVRESYKTCGECGIKLG